MTPSGDMAMGDLLSGLQSPSGTTEGLAEGAVVLRGFASHDAAALIAGIRAVADAAPFRHMATPGGHRMSVAMTNCGALGWVTDHRGYRYAPRDPESGRPWPAMPAAWRGLAGRAAARAGFQGFVPNSCLVNRYAPTAKMGLHQDKDEGDFSAPIVSVSLGLPAVFLFAAGERGDRPQRIRLHSGDVVVWGGPSRMAYHGVAPLAGGTDPLAGALRYNLTFRAAALGNR